MIDELGRAIRTFDGLRTFLRRWADDVLRRDLTELLTDEDVDPDLLDKYAELRRERDRLLIDLKLRELRESGIRESGVTYEQQ